MEQRIRFVLMVKDDVTSFTGVCRQFGISRKTGYKWWHRYKRGGTEGLKERSRRPWRSPQSTGMAWRQRVLLLRKERPGWGPKKLRARLMACAPGAPVPAASTIGRILAGVGLVRRGRKRRLPGPVVVRPGLTVATRANEVWAVDFKGWFRLGNGERCEPLTVSDLYSRYVLCCEGGPDVSYGQARPVFERLFTTQGLPNRIRLDNGPPFGSKGAAGLSQLAVWWVSLGITPEFITPGHPEQNGSHERMHRTLKAEAIEPLRHNRRAQQKQFDQWRWEFNHERPHEALGQATPASLYEKSARAYHDALDPWCYPAPYVVRRVRSNGEIRWAGRKRFIGEAFVGRSVGLKEIKTGTHWVYFQAYLLGELHERETGGLRPTILIAPARQ